MARVASRKRVTRSSKPKRRAVRLSRKSRVVGSRRTRRVMPKRAPRRRR